MWPSAKDSCQRSLFLFATAVLYFYISWVSKNDTARWFQNNIGRNCADPSRADYATYCGDIIQLCTAFRNLTKGANATVTAEADSLLSTEVGIPVAASCESFTGGVVYEAHSCELMCLDTVVMSYTLQACHICKLVHGEVCFLLLCSRFSANED